VFLRVRVLDHDFFPHGSRADLAFAIHTGRWYASIPSQTDELGNSSHLKPRVGAFRVEVDARLADRHLGRTCLIYEVTSSTTSLAGAADHEMYSSSQGPVVTVFRCVTKLVRFWSSPARYLKRDLQYKIVEEARPPSAPHAERFSRLGGALRPRMVVRRRAGLA